MKTLFWKIFFWFWLANIVLALTLLLTALAIEPVGLSRSLARPFQFFGRTVVEVLEREGPAGLEAFLNRPGFRPFEQLYILDSSGLEVRGLKLPPRAQEALGELDESVNRPVARLPFLAQSITSESGETYTLVADFFRQPNRPWNTSFRAFRPLFRQPAGPRLAAILIVAGIFCYWLARYLTKPIVTLRSASREIAGGNLSTRVAPALGQRRDELGALGADFDRMAERIESLVSSQKRLLRDISHELRSPLARLNVALELAHKSAGEPAQAALERIHRESNRLNDLIGQLLTLARLEGGAELHKRSKIELAELVKEVVQDADFEARSQGCKVAILKLEPARVLGEPGLLRSAVENVVRNAVRHTHPETTVEVSLTRLRQGETDVAQLRVRDQGRGVPDSELERIFSPFRRVDDVRNRTEGGAGLGLAITKQAIALHKGRVTARNESGKGLTVEILLPLI